METFVTVVVLLAMIALGVMLIHLLNNQHTERLNDFSYGRSRAAVRSDHRVGERGLRRPWRRARTRT